MLAVRHGVENQFHPARNPHLIEDAQQILLDGVFAEPQFDSDSTVGQAIGDERATTCCSRGVDKNLPLEFTPRSVGTSDSASGT
jgi:hypothetical protein